jgi:hypothetical protein
MEFQDKSLRCVDCGSEFIWTAGEQLFFADKQFKNEPKRCKTCKAKRANRASAGPHRANGSRHRRRARHAVRTRRFRSVQLRAVQCSARSASSSGSLQAPAASDTHRSPQQFERREGPDASLALRLYARLLTF